MHVGVKANFTPFRTSLSRGCSKRKAESTQPRAPARSTTVDPLTRQWQWTCWGSLCTRSSPQCCSEHTLPPGLRRTRTTGDPWWENAVDRSLSTACRRRRANGPYLSCSDWGDTGSKAEGLGRNWRDTTWSRPWWCCSTCPPEMRRTGMKCLKGNHIKRSFSNQNG